MSEGSEEGRRHALAWGVASALTLAVAMAATSAFLWENATFRIRGVPYPLLRAVQGAGLGALAALACLAGRRIRSGASPTLTFALLWLAVTLTYWLWSALVIGALHGSLATLTPWTLLGDAMSTSGLVAALLAHLYMSAPDAKGLVARLWFGWLGSMLLCLPVAGIQRVAFDALLDDVFLLGGFPAWCALIVTWWGLGLLRGADPFPALQEPEPASE
jgi:hypothetical protein